jgi:hypothetical protein
MRRRACGTTTKRVICRWLRPEGNSAPRADVGAGLDLDRIGRAVARRRCQGLLQLRCVGHAEFRSTGSGAEQRQGKRGCNSRYSIHILLHDDFGLRCASTLAVGSPLQRCSRCRPVPPCCAQDQSADLGTAFRSEWFWVPEANGRFVNDRDAVDSVSPCETGRFIIRLWRRTIPTT